MKKIKFRAWDTVLNNFFDGDILNDYNLVDFLNDNRYIVTQFLGIKDKNNREIYEDDIVKYKRIFYTDCSKTEIRHEDEEIVGKFYFIENVIPALKTSNEGHFRVFESAFPKLELFDCDQDFEIIGNIYENHELLNK